MPYSLINTCDSSQQNFSLVWNIFLHPLMSNFFLFFLADDANEILWWEKIFHIKVQALLLNLTVLWKLSRRKQKQNALQLYSETNFQKKFQMTFRKNKGIFLGISKKDTFSTWINLRLPSIAQNPCRENFLFLTLYNIRNLPQDYVKNFQDIRDKFFC